MKSLIRLLVVALFSTQVNFAQSFDAKLISKNAELNFAQTKQRGIEKNGIIYFVEKDLQTISAYRNNKLLWQNNVTAISGKPKVGEPKIRYFRYESKKLLVVIGKHDYVEVNPIDGKANFLGSD